MRKIGFGLEHIGLAALARPILSAIIVAFVSALAIVGIARLEYDDNVVTAFRSGSDSFRQFQQLLADRGGSSNDLVVMIEAEEPIGAAQLEHLREFHFELEFLDGVRSVLSAFSLRRILPGGEAGEPLVPDTLDDERVPELLERIREDPFGFNRAVSADHRAMVFVIVEDTEAVAGIGLRQYVGTIEAAAEAYATDGLDINVLGLQKIRFEIADSILSDLIFFNSGGSIISLLVAFLVFRNLRLTLIVVSAGVFASLLTLGAAGLAGQPMTVLTNIIPVLVIVITFTNTMHLVHFLRERPDSDHGDVAAALRESLIRIGPACALTSLTTAAAFLSLGLTGFGALVELAWFGAAASMLSFLAIISIFPLAGLVLVRGNDLGAYRREPGRAGFLLSALAPAIHRARHGIVAAALLLLLAGIAGHMATEPRFSTYDNIPEGSPTLSASLRAEDRFGGMFNVWIRIAGDPDRMMTTESGWRTITAVHVAAESVLGRNAVLSPLSLARASGHPDRPLTAEEIGRMPELLRMRTGASGSAYLTLSAMTGDPGRSDRHLAEFDALESAVLEAGAAMVTGTPALARHDARAMIEKMNWSILTAAAATIFLVALAFREARLLPAIALANMTPVLLTGIAMHLFLGGNTTIATGFAMTIAFGIAIDDTVHFINRAAFERADGRDAHEAVRNAIVGVGFVLCATTAVIGAGVSLTWFSDFVTVRLFGQLTVMILLFALIADLVILPATMLIYRKWNTR